jgi:hypothetical protein
MKNKIIKDEKGYIIKVNNVEVRSNVKLKNIKDEVYVLSFRENENNIIGVLGLCKKDWIVFNFEEII